jgi:hypothetical protein
VAHVKVLAAAGIGLALAALDVAGVVAPALDEVSMAAWGALVVIAVLSVPGGARGGEASEVPFAAAVSAPALALGAMSDARAGTAVGVAVARASFGLVFACVLLAAASRARARGRGGLHFVAWCVVLLAAPVLVVALELAGGAGAAPAAIEAVSSWSPLAWAAAELELAGRASWSEVARSAWKPALGVALVAALSWGRAKEVPS